MSSAGQVVGGVVGGIIGFFAGGNVMLGASIGMAIGGYIDPPEGPKGRPPSTSDLAVQTATYGAPLGDGDGSYATMGNIFWVKGNTLDAVERELEGGKGGGSSAGTTYDIYGTFAVGFGEGEIEGYGKIWFSSQLVMDNTSGDLGAIIASNEAGGSITLYRGSMDQLPDPDIQADMGAANTPAYRGLHYIVVKNWPMADFGNSLIGLQVKAEIVNGPPVADDALVATALVPTSGNERLYSLCKLEQDRITLTSLTFMTWDYDLVSVHQQQYVFGSTGFAGLSDVALPPYHTGPFATKIPLYSLQSDIDCVVFAYYVNTPTTRIFAHDAAGASICDSYYIPAATLPYVDYRCVIDRGDLFLMGTGYKLYKLPVFINDGSAPLDVESSSGTFTVERFGVSENYVFAVLRSASSPTSCTVYKIDRVSLATVETYTQSISGSYAIIHVISDVEFYTMATDGNIWRWVSGVATDTGLRYTGGAEQDNRLLVFSSSMAYVVKDGDPPTVYVCWLAASRQLVPLADIIERRCLKSRLLSIGDLDTSDITQDVRGYKVSNIAAIRASLEPLQAAWPFDVIPHGYQIKFVARGKSSVVTIDESELGCVEDGQKPGVRVTASREMDSQLPRKVLVSYLDVNREYDTNTGPGAERLSSDTVNVLQLDLAIVMNADEAAQTEEVLLYMYWLGRHDVSFVLPPTRMNLEPADVVTITAGSATYELRLTAINYLPDGRLECSAKFNNVAVYTSSAVGQEGDSVGQIIAYGGPSNLLLLDVPVMNDIMDAPGLLAGMGGYLDGWPGGTLYRSSDAGQTWASIQGFSTGMVSGLAVNSIDAGRTDIIDAHSRLNIRLHAGDLYSVSLEAMLNGANWLAYGADGRWEVIAAQNVTSESDGSLTLTDMLRGRFGTEWAMDSHVPYDEIVLLDSAVLKFIGMNTGDINLLKTYRAVTAGRTFDSASDETQTYAAVNLKPLSPVYLNGHRDQATGDWTLTCTRRTRIGGEWRDGMDVPLGESSEAYEVEILNSDYSTLKRTITGLTTASASYTAAQQVTDFGSAQSTLYVKWYQLSATVGRGYPLVASITRADPDDPYGYAVVLGMHLSTGLSCVKGRVATAYGNAAVSGGYLNLDGTNDYLLLDGAGTLAPGTGPYCIEMRYTPTTQGDFSLWDSRPNATNGWYVSLFATAAGGVKFFANSADRINSASSVLSNGVESHIALTRTASGDWKLWINGTQAGSTYNDTSNYINAAGRPAIGANGASLAVSNVNGKIREIRATSADRYTTTFTPPAAPFPNP